VFKKPRIKMTRILCVLFLSLFLASVYAHDENNEGSCANFIDNNLRFTNIKPFYNVGELMEIDLEAHVNATSRFHLVDLWVAIEMPNGELLFKTPFNFQPFSREPQPFMLSLGDISENFTIVKFEVPVGFGGNYSFYAAYVEEGKSPMVDGLLVIKDIVNATTVLYDY